MLIWTSQNSSAVSPSVVSHRWGGKLSDHYSCTVSVSSASIHLYDRCVCTFTYLSSSQKPRRDICLHSIVTFDSEACTPFSNSPIQAYYFLRAFCTIAFPQISIKALIFSLLNLAAIALVKVYICSTKTQAKPHLSLCWFTFDPSQYVDSVTKSSV